MHTTHKLVSTNSLAKWYVQWQNSPQYSELQKPIMWTAYQWIQIA